MNGQLKIMKKQKIIKIQNVDTGALRKYMSITLLNNPNTNLRIYFAFTKDFANRITPGNLDSIISTDWRRRFEPINSFVLADGTVQFNIKVPIMSLYYCLRRTKEKKQLIEVHVAVKQ